MKNIIIDLFKSAEDKEIDRVAEWMQKFEVDSKEFECGVRLIERLTEVKDRRSKSKIKPEVWVPAVTSIAGILIVLNYEKLGVISGKAFNMIKFK